MRPSTILLAATAATIPIRCGPTDQEAATAVLMAAPAVLVVSLGLLLLLLKLWRRVDPALTMRPAPLGWLFVGLSVAGLAQVPLATELGAIDLVPIAIWAFGTSYLTILLVLWRVMLAKRPGSAFTVAPIVPMLVLTLAGVPMALGLTGDHDFGGTFYTRVVGILWVYPGAAGIVAGPLLLGLLIEAMVRARRARSPEGA